MARNVSRRTRPLQAGAAGEAACNSTHGANRLGANSTSECIVWGRITGEQAAQFALERKGSTIEISNDQVISEEKRIYDGIFRGRGEANPYEVRKKLTDTMDDKAYVFRTE